MPPIERVHPGDLITSQLLNDIIDRLNALQVKVDKCCEDLEKEPEPAPGEPPRDEEPTKLTVIGVAPDAAEVGDTVTVSGTGFIRGANKITIGKAEVTNITRESPTRIDLVVPNPRAVLPSDLRLEVSNRNGTDFVILRVERTTGGARVSILDVKPKKITSGIKLAMLLQASKLAEGAYEPQVSVAIEGEPAPANQKQKPFAVRDPEKPANFELTVDVPRTTQPTATLRLALPEQGGGKNVWERSIELTFGKPFPPTLIVGAPERVVRGPGR